MEKNDSAEMTLADVIGGGESVEANQQENQVTEEQTANASEVGQQTEPGYVQRRIQHALRETEAKYEGQLAELRSQLNVLTEANLAVQARERVAAGDFKNEELAMEYLRMKNGIAAPEKVQPEQGKPRDAQGRFMKAEEVPSETQQKANELVAQANTLHKATGVDVLGLYNENPEIQQKVLSGEWDFTDVLKHAQAGNSRKTVPTVRNANGVGLGGYDIRGMRSNDFAKLNKALEEGTVIDMSK